MKHCKQAREILWISLFRFLSKEAQEKDLMNPDDLFGNTANFTESELKSKYILNGFK
jgi:hypothetical protein